jgi:hypothetical protein
LFLGSSFEVVSFFSKFVYLNMASLQNKGVSYSPKFITQWRHINVSVLEVANCYFDLGVSKHMKNRKDLFISIMEVRYKTKKTILGDGRAHVVEGHDNVQL